MAPHPSIAKDTGISEMEIKALNILSPHAAFSSMFNGSDLLAADFQSQWSDMLQSPFPTPLPALYQPPVSAITSTMRTVIAQSTHQTTMTGPPNHPFHTMEFSRQQNASGTAEHGSQPLRDPHSPPAAKRQRRSVQQMDKNLDFQGMYNAGDTSRRDSLDTRSSECCSSCSEGAFCAEPDCEDAKTSPVTCTVPECKRQSPCPDSCRRDVTRGGQAPAHEEVVPSSTRLMNWDYTPWNPQLRRSSSTTSRPMFPDGSPDFIDRVERLHDASRPGSAVPTTPSMGNNMETPFSPANALPTPLSTDKSLTAYPNSVSSILSGAGTLFAPPDHLWSQQIYGVSNLGPGSSMFSCAWSGCAQPFTSQQEWTEHIHRAHVDPQMTFDCPMPTGNCPQNISHNPIHHLEVDHGFNFLTENQISCPAPDCDPGHIFLNPTMLHNHFDQAHAIPASGSLFCKWDSCDTAFSDPHQLFTHLNEHHQLTNLLSTENNGFPKHPNPLKYPAAIPDAELSDDDTRNRCKWKTGYGIICGTVCQTEIDLQNHVKEAHLKSLNNRIGYNCQWEDCCRPAKLGNKSGFTARGKLERHMATHTGYKMSRCDICNEVFSAPQSMKQHRRLHTGEKPWVCKYCGKTFPQQSACTIHERIHTNEKPLQCPYPGCRARFSDSSNLAKHRKTHGEEGVHVCKFPGCSKSFHRLDQLKRHRAVHQTASDISPSLEPVKAEADSSEAGFNLSEVSSQVPSSGVGGEETV